MNDVYLRQTFFRGRLFFVWKQQNISSVLNVCQMIIVEQQCDSRITDKESTLYIGFSFKSLASSKPLASFAVSCTIGDTIGVEVLCERFSI